MVSWFLSEAVKHCECRISVFSQVFITHAHSWQNSDSMSLLNGKYFSPGTSIHTIEFKSDTKIPRQQAAEIRILLKAASCKDVQCLSTLSASGELGEEMAEGAQLHFVDFVFVNLDTNSSDHTMAV